PSIRTSVRSSYSARVISSGVTPSIRAHADMYTDAGSVAWKATMSPATATTSSPLAPAARCWRRPSRGRRSSLVTPRMATEGYRLGGAGAVGAAAAEDDLDAVDAHPVALVAGEGEAVDPGRLDVEDTPAAVTDQVVVVGPGLRVVAGAAVADVDGA